jgi:hypothetical protein
VLVFGVYILAGVGFYQWRRRWLAAQGIDLETALRKDA